VSNEIIVLAGTAATLGLVHTLVGPDHYLPFVVLSRARNWSTVKTAVVTLLCGIGHVLGSIALGFIGIALGIAVFRLEAIESSRGEIAAWLLIGFGFAYFAWGLRKAVRRRHHEHVHPHEDGKDHSHSHKHTQEHTHVHMSSYRSLTPWILFTIFVFGPCEPLIPLVMYPAAKDNMVGVAIVASIFGLVTVATMLATVLTSSYGLSKLPLQHVERYSHAFAGLSIFLCGGAIKFLGL
jgi:sulfite exporter TauE/SafE